MSLMAGLGAAAGEKMIAAAGEAVVNPAVQQIAIADQISTLSQQALRPSCLDLQTGKLSPDEVLNSQNIVQEIPTRNECLEGDVHPITGVPFERNTVFDGCGNEVTGVFPKFDSTFDAQLPDDLLQASDSEQFAECNQQLGEAIENDPDLANKFSDEQIEQIKNGDTPDGLTWHHHEEIGKMQLVDSDIHAHTGHTGGKSIWGGGTDNR